MTNEDAIKELKLMRYNDANTGDMDRALAMAIEALSNNQNPSVSEVKTNTNSVSEADVIYRADAIYHCRKRLYQTAEVNRPIEVYADIAENRIGEWLNELPSAHLVNDSQGFSQGDLISRQALIDAIDEWIKAFLENGHKESAAGACLIQDGIIQLPSAQPEIIRCKDCRHGVDYYHEGDCYCSNPKWGLKYFGGSWEFYCADAERRGEQDDQ